MRSAGALSAFDSLVLCRSCSTEDRRPSGLLNKAKVVVESEVPSVDVPESFVLTSRRDAT